MTDRPEFIVQGERARLFPVLSETSREGRTLSILLSCMENVNEFGRGLLSDLGIRAGVRTKIEAYTEVVLKKCGDKNLRPDGLIVVRTGSKIWTALVEAKVGNADLNVDQLEAYLEIAKLNGIDGLVTISNQFAPMPTQLPVQLSAAALKKANVLHWSWKYIITQASLLIRNDDVLDQDQRVILNEMVRFLSHPSAGVQSFDQMPASWTTLASNIQAGASVSVKSLETQEVIAAWYQEIQDLSLILSRHLGEDVDIKVPRAHASDPIARMKADIHGLAEDFSLKAVFSVPNAVSSIDVVADFAKRSVFACMKVNAPEDRKSTKARLNWLLRQLQKSNPDNIHVRLIWPGRGQRSQYTLKALRDNVDIADEAGKVVSSFEVLYARDLGARFGQRKNFIIDLEQIVPDFYEQVGQHLRAWQPQAPKIRDEASNELKHAENEIEAIAAEAEDVVNSGE